MLIEFVGCSGAGKTTLVKMVAAELKARGYHAILSQEVVKSKTRTAWIRNDSLRNLILSFLLIPYFLIQKKSKPGLFAFANVCIKRYEKSFERKVSRKLSLMRLMGENFLIRQLDDNRLIFVDEGIFGAAHNILVYVDSTPLPSEVSRFVETVPLPDLIVHVDVPIDIALGRTLQRPDPPLRNASNRDLKAFIAHGVKIFSELVKGEWLMNHTLTVINDGPDIELLTRKISYYIVEKIIEKNPKPSWDLLQK